MKTKLLQLSLLLISIVGYSQIHFEKGYFITIANQKVECLIRNQDWKYNPSEFEYKLTENSERKIETIRSVKEFGINSVCKYVKVSLKMERSSDNLNRLSLHKEPLFRDETCFLKVLVSGKANLFGYFESDLKRYFFNKDSLNIEPLICKSYLIDGTAVATNFTYKHQLYDQLKYPDLTITAINYIKYDTDDLVTFFETYNKSEDSHYESKFVTEKKRLFHLSVRGGINSASVLINNPYAPSRSTEFNLQRSLRVGIEFEKEMGYNKGKWAIPFELAYQSYNDNQQLAAEMVTINYKSIEASFGARHYLFLSDNSKLFLNVCAIIDLNLKSKIDFSLPYHDDLEIKTGPNFCAGFGYKFKNKVSVEARFYSNRQVLVNYSAWNSSYSNSSIILGYTIF